VRQLKVLNDVLTEYDQQVETLTRTPQYEKPVQALTCYKCIKNLFALSMITKIDEANRFPYPRQLAPWVGMNIREYSSGGKHNRFAITQGFGYKKNDHNTPAYQDRILVTLSTLHSQESVLQTTAFKIVGKFLFHMQGQGLALHGHHIPKQRVTLLDDLIEQCPFWSMTFIGRAVG
jgi:hypothetical protein